MKNKYPFVAKFRKKLPQFGLGEPKPFADVAEVFEETLKDICSLAEMSLIGRRMEYNMANENNPNILSFSEWYFSLKTSDEDDFLKYMINNYPLKNGYFQVGYNKNRIEELAKTLFSYIKK